MGKNYDDATNEQLKRWLQAANADARDQRVKKGRWKAYAVKLEREIAELRDVVESKTAH